MLANNRMHTSSKKTCVLRSICFSSVSSRKLRFNASAFWLTSRSSFSSFSKVAWNANDSQIRRKVFQIATDLPPSQSFRVAVVLLDSRRCPAWVCHPSWSPSPSSAICAPSHRNGAPHSQIYVGMHSRPDWAVWILIILCLLLYAKLHLHHETGPGPARRAPRRRHRPLRSVGRADRAPSPRYGIMNPFWQLSSLWLITSCCKKKKTKNKN